MVNNSFKEDINLVWLCLVVFEVLCDVCINICMWDLLVLDVFECMFI